MHVLNGFKSVHIPVERYELQHGNVRIDCGSRDFTGATFEAQVAKLHIIYQLSIKTTVE